MKAILQKIVLIGLLLTAFALKSFGSTYDWVGTTNAWNVASNWQIAGVTATVVPGAADIVRIAVVPFTNAPTITDARSCASMVFGTYDNFTLTVNSTLTVTGNILQNNDPNFYQYTVLAGTGTITCGSLTIGDSTQPSSNTGTVINVSSQVNQLTISGNLTLNSVGNSTGTGIAYPFFSLDANKLSLSGQIVTTTTTSPLSGGVGDPNYPGLGLFQMDRGTSNTTLELLNVTPIVTPITSGFTIDFTNNGSGTGTVLYDAASGSQTIYTTGTSGIGINPSNYDYVTLSGASTKVIGSGALTVINDFTTGGTTTLNLSTNNPTITVGGNLINSTSITQGSGNISITNALKSSAGTITLGTGTLTVSNGVQLTGGTIAGGSGAITVSGAFQNTAGTFTGGSGTVTFKGDYTNSSTFTPGTGTIYFSGTVAQTLTDNSASGTAFKNVTFNGSSTVTMAAGTGNFSVASTGVLTVTSPAKLVAGSSSAAYLTLKSDASGTATVAAMSGTASVTGWVNVQRYLTGGTAAYRGYRLLSNSVYVGTVSSNNVYNFDYVKASMLLTGSATGGFDKTGNPSLYMYRENQAFSTVAFTLGNFSEVSAINNAPTYNVYTDGTTTAYTPIAGNGFLVFFRGDRTTNLANKYKPGTVAESVTLTQTGTLNQGQITVHDWYTPASANLGYTTTAGNATVRGYNLVGNPYASSINWDLFNTTTTTSGIYGSAVGSTVYVLDPVSKNYGAYVAGTGGVGTHNTTNILPSGQGFFVVATAATAQLIFNESAKSNTQVTGASLLMGLPKELANLQYMNLMMAKDSVTTDDVIIHLRDNVSTAYKPQTDAIYNPGYGGVSLSSTSSDNRQLAISTQPFPKTKSRIPLSVNATTDGTYQLVMKNIAGIPKLYRIWLVDNLTKDSVNMRAMKAYSFTINKADSSTFGPNRFMLSLDQDPNYAYQLVDFRGNKIPSQATRAVQLNWQTRFEGNYTTFTVERSNDGGKTFAVVGGKQGNNSQLYGITDNNAQAGLNIYRLKQQDINNAITYSPLVQVEYTVMSNSLSDANIHVYPNPAKSNITLTIASTAIAKTPAYKIRISNSSGLMVREVNATQSNWQGSITDLLTGTYVIQVINTKDDSLVGQTKFVKL